MLIATSINIENNGINNNQAMITDNNNYDTDNDI